MTEYYPQMMSIDRDVEAITITNHASQRMRVRGQLKLNQAQRENINSFIEIDFRRSLVDRKTELVPFYRNKLWTRSNGRAYISESNMFTYVWKYIPDKKLALILTIY